MLKAKNNLSSDIIKLSVLIHQDGLSFFIYSSTGIIDSLHKSFKHESNPIEILHEIEMIYENEKRLSENSFDQVHLIFHHPIFTGVPSSIYNENNQADYLKYNTRLLDSDVISSDETIESVDYKTVYIAYSNINNYFFEKYGDFNYYHYSTLALTRHKLLAEHDSSSILIDIKESHFYITIFDQGELQLHNCYPYQEIEDILYYTLFTAHHNRLDPELMNLKILSSEKNDKLYDLLYTYVRNVSYVLDSKEYLEQILCV